MLDKNQTKSGSITNKIRSLPCKLLLLIPWAFLGAGAGVLIYQVHLWQKTKSWLPIRASVLIKRILPPEFFQQLSTADPLGLKQSASAALNASLAAFLFTCGVLLLMLAVLVLTSIDNRAAREKINEQKKHHIPIEYAT